MCPAVKCARHSSSITKCSISRSTDLGLFLLLTGCLQLKHKNKSPGLVGLNVEMMSVFALCFLDRETVVVVTSIQWFKFSTRSNSMWMCCDSLVQ